MQKLLVLIFFINILDILGHSYEVNDQTTFDLIRSKNYVMLNFHVGWCIHCRRLDPDFEAASAAINPHYQDAVLAKIDCEISAKTCGFYKVDRYPTLKVFRRGEFKKEYHGERKSQSIIDYVLADIRTEPLNIVSLDQIDKTKDYMLGSFQNKNRPEYLEYVKVTKNLIDDCISYTYINESVMKNQISFVSMADPQTPVVFEAPFNGINLESWAIEQCRPMIKEITFKNAEALTADGLPLLLLFYTQGDSDSRMVFYETLKNNRDIWEGKFLPVYAKASTFERAIQRLRKTSADAPIVAVDDFSHLYDFEDFTQFRNRDAIIKFFESIKEKQQQIVIRFQEIIFGAFEMHHQMPQKQMHKSPNKIQTTQQKVQKPAEIHKEAKQKAAEEVGGPQSAFKNLAPNEKRYTWARDKDDL